MLVSRSCLIQLPLSQAGEGICSCLLPWSVFNEQVESACVYSAGSSSVSRCAPLLGSCRFEAAVGIHQRLRHFIGTLCYCQMILILRILLAFSCSQGMVSLKCQVRDSAPLDAAQPPHAHFIWSWRMEHLNYGFKIVKTIFWILKRIREIFNACF